MARCRRRGARRRPARARAAATGCCSTAARGPSGRCSARPGSCQLDEIYITHFHADHYLGLPGLLKTYDLQDRAAPLRIYGPPGLRDLFEVAAADRSGEPAYETRAGRAGPRGGGRARRLRGRARSRSSTACAPTATRWSRRSGRGASTPSARRGARRRARARTSGACSAARRSRGSDGAVRPEDVMGETAAGPQGRDHRRHRARARSTRVAAHAGRAAGPRRQLRRRGGRARRRDRPLDRRRRPRAGARGGGEMLALVHVSSRYNVGEVLEEARESFPASASRRATSTWSRSRSPSAASRVLVASGARERRVDGRGTRGGRFRPSWRWPAAIALATAGAWSSWRKCFAGSRIGSSTPSDLLDGLAGAPRPAPGPARPRRPAPGRAARASPLPQKPLLLLGAARSRA